MNNNLAEKSDSVQIRRRNWAFVAYPESLPEDWQEILKQTGLPVAISPLHDKDVNPDKTKKKPHYHIILAYSGPTSFSVVKKITDKLNAPAPISLEAIRGYYRYFTHRDNPEKYQYAEKDIKTLNDFAILDFVEIKKSEVIKIKKDLVNIICREIILDYSDLIIYAMTKLTDAEFDVASTNTIFFDRFISGLRYKKLGKK